MQLRPPAHITITDQILPFALNQYDLEPREFAQKEMHNLHLTENTYIADIFSSLLEPL